MSQLGSNSFIQAMLANVRITPDGGRRADVSGRPKCCPLSSPAVAILRARGEINQLLHIWKFRDDGDRRAHWAAVFENKDFVEGFASKFRPLVMSQEVKLMTEAVGAASVGGRCQAS